MAARIVFCTFYYMKSAWYDKSCQRLTIIIIIIIVVVIIIIIIIIIICEWIDTCKLLKLILVVPGLVLYFHGYVDNTLISNTVLIHLKPTFSISAPPENIRIPKVFWCFKGYRNGTLA